MQRLQYPKQNTVYNLNNARLEVSRQFKKKKSSYRKARFDNLETNSKILFIGVLCMGTNNLKKIYQPRINTAKDVKDDMVTDSQSILVGWRNHFSRLINVHGVRKLRQRAEIHEAEPLMP
jgi:hypothetical protein